VGAVTAYADRLDAARRLFEWLRATGGVDLPTDLADQLGAATRDTYQRFNVMAAVLPILEGRDWHRHAVQHPNPSVDECHARTLAAIAGFTSCPHLRDRTASPRPVYARMPLRRLDCERCTRTFRNPPPGEADRCDWCGKRGVIEFWPLVYTTGPMLVAGDACDDCHAGLVPEGASA